jgi:hypothetical protein
VDIDRARLSCVLESQDNQSVCVEYRSSLAGGTSPDTVICWRSQLPCAFARPAGWGDIVIGVTAVALVSSMHTQFAKTVLLSWNTLGLIDIVFVVSSALRFGLKDWQSMHALRELPLSLLPTFLVPLIIASHVLIFVRLSRARIGSQ